MNALELADWFDGRILYLWDTEDGQYYDSAIASEIVPTLRQQQAEIDSLYYENSMLKNRHRLQKSTIEALKTKLNKAIDAEKHRRFE